MQLLHSPGQTQPFSQLIYVNSRRLSRLLLLISASLTYDWDPSKKTSPLEISLRLILTDKHQSILVFPLNPIPSLSLSLTHLRSHTHTHTHPYNLAQNLNLHYSRRLIFHTHSCTLFLNHTLSDVPSQFRINMLLNLSFSLSLSLIHTHTDAHPHPFTLSLTLHPLLSLSYT